MSRPRIGLALGSGSARGWSHIGVIDALAEAGVEPDIVCGTSMGAFVGAAYVAGKLGDLRLWTETVGWREIVGLLDLRLLGGGLIDGRQIVGFLRRLEIDRDIGDYEKPFAAIATDLKTGGECVLTSGPIDAAVRASIALPGIFRPYRIEERWLLDGGLVNPVPVSACRALGADIVIAVNLNSERVGRHPTKKRRMLRPAPKAKEGRAPRTFLIDRIRTQMPVAMRRPTEMVAARLMRPDVLNPGYFEVLANSINIMQAQITEQRLAVELPEIVLSPSLRDIGVLEFNRAAEAINEGRAAVARALPEIRKVC